MRILLSQNTLKKYRISPVYEPDYIFSLSGHLCTAPLEVVNHGGNKCHVIVNHSFQNNKLPIDIDNLPLNTPGKYIIDPSQTSINTVVDLKNFQCAWSSFSKCYLLVADAPEGTQAAVFDVDAAFRNIPTHPSACLFLAIMIKGLIHLDHVLNFGASFLRGSLAESPMLWWDFFLHEALKQLLNGILFSYTILLDICWMALMTFLTQQISSGASQTSWASFGLWPNLLILLPLSITLVSSGTSLPSLFNYPQRRS